MSIAASYAAAAYTQQGAKLVGSGGGIGGRQGSSVALSADGNTAIVGSMDDGNPNNVGAAWVFTRSGGTWTQQGNKLIGTGAAGNSRQGGSVALSADGNTAIVGGFADNGDVGAAWIYTRSGGVWTQQGGKLVGSGATGTSYQGISVSMSADGNTAVVGGAGDNSFAGAAWVFTRSGSVWTQQGGKLVGTLAAGNAGQGESVALSADGNTVAVGGYRDNSDLGATWVFTRSGGMWTQQGSKLVGTGGAGAAKNQGRSVAASADGNTVAVGGYGDNSYVGATWVFTRSAGVWSQQGGKLVGSGSVSASSQGTSVGLSSDGNILVVGGYGDNGQTGAAWLFKRSNGGWTQYGSKLVGTGAAGNAGQGQSVALSADGTTVLVGGYFDNSQTGAAWVHAAPAGPELVAGGAPGWYAPSVPFKNGVGSSFSAPTVLDGNVSNTIFAYSYSNTGPATATGFVTNETIDGVVAFSWTPGSLSPSSGVAWNSAPRTVAGGLHTMGFKSDVTNTIDEINEGNGNHASQWAWSPLPMTLGVPVVRPALPDPKGGWEDIPLGLPRYPNVDGLRSPTFVNQWGVVALAPTDPASNPDLQAYSTLSTGPGNGFRTPNETSGRPGDATDLVLMDAQGISSSLDVGLYRSAGTTPVVVHARSSTLLALSGGATDFYGPFSLGPDSLVALFSLDNGAPTNRTIALVNLSGGANLDFKLFGHTDPSRLYNPGEAAATAAANGEGWNEYYFGAIPVQPALVVYKAGSSDVAKTALFRIIITSPVAGVDDDVPPSIAFAPITPNPVRDGATMSLDVPRELHVDLAAYDIGGRRVSTLANGTWNAGRHQIRWTMQSDGGTPLPDGMYVVRFSAGGYQASRRVVVVR